MTKVAKNTAKRNKKEEQKKMMVRIICMVMVIALVLTSGIAVLGSLFQKDISEVLADQGMTMLGYDEVGNIYALDQAGQFVLVDEHGHVVEVLDMGVAEEDHEGHDHAAE